MAADFDEAKEREAFEAWYNQHGAFRPIQRQASGHYWPTHACEAWEAWQARALQPSAPALPVEAIKSAIHALERSKIGVEYRDTLVTYDAHIESLRALLPPAEQ